jgi:hypothetical protein
VSLIVNLLLDPFANFSLFEVFYIVLLVSSPTWFGFLFHVERRIVKDLLRISMGLGWGIALAELLLQPSWIDKIIIFLIIVGFLLIFQRLRKRQTRRSASLLCDNCRELNDNACSGYKYQYEAERLYSRELSDFLQQKLSWNDIRMNVEKDRS